MASYGHKLMKRKNRGIQGKKKPPNQNTPVRGPKCVI